MDFEGIFFDTTEYTKKGKAIGQGQFGKVFIVEREKDSKQFAAKIINFQKIFTGKEQMHLMREFLILSKLDHPAIVKFYGINFHSFDDPSKLEPTIIMDYLSNGSFKDILKKEQSGLAGSDWDTTKKYICLLGICDAMRYLHAKGVIHRDLKPENILIDEHYYPYVCDFGLSRCFPNSLSNSMKLSMTGKIGTPLYMAPELLEDEEHYGVGVDVYSFALLAYEIIAGKEPFSENGKPITLTKLLAKVQNGERPKLDGSFTEQMKSLITRCWSKYADERPSFEEIFKELSSDFSYFAEYVDEDEVMAYLEYLEENRNEESSKKKPQSESIIGSRSNNNSNNGNNNVANKNNNDDDYLDMIQKLISNNGDFEYIRFESVNGNLLLSACKSGNLKLVKYLISLNKLEITSANILIFCFK